MLAPDQYGWSTWWEATATDSASGSYDANFDYDHTYSTHYGNNSSYANSQVHNTLSGQLDMQRLSERYADGSFWPVAGYSTDLLIAHGVATSDHHGYSNGQYYSTTTYDEFGVDGGCRELRTFIWHPNATYTVSQYNTNAFTGHRDSTDTGYSSYGEPTPVTGSEFSSATYPDNTIVTTITIYLTNFYRYYSGRYYSDGAMMNGPPKSGYLGGGLTHGWSNNEQPTPFYNFLHAGIDPLAVDALMTTGHMPTMKSQATWMTGASARMPAALGLVSFPSAAQMSPANTDYWTRMPWSAPAHDHTPRFESIPLHEPDGTGTGETQGYMCMASLSSEGGEESSTSTSTAYSYTFDTSGRIASMTDPNSGVTTFTYDAAGDLASLTDPNGNTTTWVYDSDRRVIQETDALGASRYFEYDEYGDLTRYTDRDGRVRIYQYDSNHRVTSETWYANATDADLEQNALNAILYTYDSAGNLLSESDNQSSYIYTYDYWGQLTSVTSANAGGPTVVFVITYDDYGDRTSLSAAIDGVDDFQNDYVYDDYGRIQSVHQHGVSGGNAVADKRVDLAYDDWGSLSSLSRSLGSQLAVQSDFSYDLFGRLVGISHRQGETPLAGYTFAYNGQPSSGQLVSSHILSDDSSAWLPAGGLLPVHDTQNIVAALVAAASTGNVANYLAAVYSADGTVSYAYDSTGQLIGATYSGEGLPDESYAWDANGNPTGAGCIVGLDNLLLSDGTYRYLYDAEGNRTVRFIDVNEDGLLGSGDTSITQYAWDARNRLVEVRDYTDYATLSGNLPTQVVDYLYDVEDRWIGENIDSDGDGAVDHQTRFAYDGNQIVLQFDKAGTGTVTGADLSHRYLWQPNAVDQIMADEQLSPLPPGEGQGEGSAGYDLSAPGNVIWPLADQLGTVRDLAVFDAQTGITSIANHRVYDSFGSLKSQTNAAVDCLFGFTGRAFDASTGLQDNWHRKYDPSTRNWLSKDMIGFTAGDVNARRYAGNSPTNATDPTGTATLQEIKSQVETFLNYLVKVTTDITGGTLQTVVNSIIAAKIAIDYDGLQAELERSNGSLEVQIPLGTICGASIVEKVTLTNVKVVQIKNTETTTQYDVSWTLKTNIDVGAIKASDSAKNIQQLATLITDAARKGVNFVGDSLLGVLTWADKRLAPLGDLLRGDVGKFGKRLVSGVGEDFHNLIGLPEKGWKVLSSKRTNVTMDGTVTVLDKEPTLTAYLNIPKAGGTTEKVALATLTVPYYDKKSSPKWTVTEIEEVWDKVRSALPNLYGLLDSDTWKAKFKQALASLERQFTHDFLHDDLQTAINNLTTNLKKALNIEVSLPLTIEYHFYIEYTGTLTFTKK